MITPTNPLSLHLLSRTLHPMKRFLLVLAIAAATLAVTSGCKSDKGSREYIPGKGWRPV